MASWIVPIHSTSSTAHPPVTPSPSLTAMTAPAYRRPSFVMELNIACLGLMKLDVQVNKKIILKKKTIIHLDEDPISNAHLFY